MQVLVTGGAGFVGSILVDRLLAEGHHVDVVDNLRTGSLANLADARRARARELTFHQLDVRSGDVADLIARRRPEVIWHLAAHEPPADSVDHAAVDADVNIVGALNMLEAAWTSGCRKVVLTSSASAVYSEPGSSAVTERQPRQPRLPHGIAKHAVDAYAVAFRELHGLEFTSVVLGTVYGPRDANGVVAVWAGALLDGEPCRVFGDGSKTRDFVFVDDVVDALSRAGAAGDGLMLNVGSGTETSLKALHRFLCEAFARAGCPVSNDGLVPQPARPGELSRCRLDTARAGIYLDWKPWTTVEQGLAAYVDHLLAGGRRVAASAPSPGDDTGAQKT